jgi:hypothetical protein
VTETSTAELSLTETTPSPEPVGAPAPTLEPGLTHTRLAVRKCGAAYRRAFHVFIETADREEPSWDRSRAADQAGLAYREAMPLLSSFEGVRDFIACTAHGILMGAIPPEQSGRLLYAAQVALAALQREPKPRKPA